MKELVVIGGASAAQSAAVYAARAGVEVTIVADEYGGQINNTDVVENYLGFKSIEGPELAKRYVEHMRDYDVDEMLGQKAVDIRRPDHFEVELEDGTVLEALSVIIATGGSRRKLGVKGEKELSGRGVGYCAVCDGPLYQGEEVAIVGAGYAATEAIDYMTDIAEKIYVINRSKGYSGEEITIERIEDHEKVEHWENSEIVEFYSGDQLLEGAVINKDGEEVELEVPGIFIEIGTKPNSDLTELIEKTDGSRIKVDSQMSTGVKGLYAAGDVNNKGVQQLAVSVGQGCIAGLNAAEYIKEHRQ